MKKLKKKMANETILTIIFKYSREKEKRKQNERKK